MRERYMKASFTVEASLLMALILPFIVALLVGGFFIHDRGYLQGAACEAAAMASNLMQYDDAQAEVSALVTKRTSRSMNWAKGASGSASAGEDEAAASLSAQFTIPGFAARFLTGGTIEISGKWERILYHPAKLIRKVRGAKYLIDLALEGEG